MYAYFSCSLIYDKWHEEGEQKIQNTLILENDGIGDQPCFSKTLTNGHKNKYMIYFKGYTKSMCLLEVILWDVI